MLSFRTNAGSSILVAHEGRRALDDASCTIPVVAASALAGIAVPILSSGANAGTSVPDPPTGAGGRIVHATVTLRMLSGGANAGVAAGICDERGSALDCARRTVPRVPRLALAGITVPRTSAGAGLAGVSYLVLPLRANAGVAAGLERRLAGDGVTTALASAPRTSDGEEQRAQHPTHDVLHTPSAFGSLQPKMGTSV